MITLSDRLGEGQDLPGAVYVTTRGPWHFTRQLSLQGPYVDEFFALYELAFNPLKKLSVARQVLSRAEFVDQMLDERVVKYVAWSDSGEPMGLTTLTTELDSVPWISPDYFEEHYPEQWARHAVYYLGFTLVHPSQRHSRFIETIVDVGMKEELVKNSVVAYDTCAFNNQTLRFNERISTVLEDLPEAHLEVIDTQIYACVTIA
ncbi:MAG TPA: hypothetical protein VIT20_04495 [Propionibacteriaceae bacterium]